MESGREDGDMSETQLHQIKDEILSGIQNIIGDRLHKIILYGSYARGDFHDDSDMDIMILADVDDEEIHPHKKELRRMAGKIALENDVVISMFLKNKKFFDEHVSVLPFYQNVIKDRIALYDK